MTTIEYRSAPITDIDTDKHELRAQILTFGVPDTYGSVWEPGVFDRSLETNPNPVACLGHDRMQVVGSWRDITATGKGYEGTLAFANIEHVPEARKAWSLTSDKHVRDVSVGFSRRGGAWRDTSKDKDRLDGERERISRAGLSEVSVVSHGAVPGASVLTVRADGVSILPADVADLLTRMSLGEITLLDALNIVEGRAMGKAHPYDPDGDGDDDTGECATCGKTKAAGNHETAKRETEPAELEVRTAIAAWDSLRAEGLISRDAYERVAGSGAGSSAKLKAYWSKGEGAAKIGWGTAGDFKRCEAEVGKYVPAHEVAGYCSNLHVLATGARPGHAPGE